MASKLLIDDYPIQVLPTLAKEIGLNEAIVLQQMHYWLNMSKHNYDDKKWIYNSYTKWVLQFPFWSESTVKRAIGSLEKQNLLYIGNYNKAGFDKTKWYSINYEELNKRVTRPSGQNDPTMSSKWSDDEFNLNRPIPETTTKTTTKTSNTSRSKLKFETHHLKLAELLYKEILHNNPQHKKPNLESWANDFRLMMEIDKREGKEIQELILFSQSHDFWYKNILSAGKLREKYDVLILEKYGKQGNKKDRKVAKF